MQTTEEARSGAGTGSTSAIRRMPPSLAGGVADYSASKKRFLLLFCALSWGATGLLFFVQASNLLLGMLFFILAEIGYRGGQVFYNALLLDGATPEEMGRVSGNGWAFGSVGGIVCLPHSEDPPPARGRPQRGEIPLG